MASNQNKSFLDSIPGYGGYRDKERRRESDRRIREKLATDYGQLADRLSRLARRMAEDRKLAAIGLVDRPHKRLVHFIDRMKTATYGYAGLFSDRSVDEAALDQIAAFDRSLNDHLGAVETAIANLEAADPESEEFRTRSDELSAVVDGLHERFDRRGEVIETGTALAEVSVTDLLAPVEAGPTTPAAYNLHEGEAVSRAGVNYTVVGRITIETPGGSWRLFQLEGGEGHNWLQAPASSDSQFRWLREGQPSGSTGDPTIALDEATYNPHESSAGSAEVIAKGGATEGREVQIHQYKDFSGERLLTVYDWGADQLALAGEIIDPIELELWSREGGKAV